MDAPGFPDPPQSTGLIIVLWLALLLVAAAGLLITVVSARRAGGRRRTIMILGAVSLAGALVAAVVMWLPAYVFSSPTGGGTCPIDAMSMAFMGGDRASELYRYWSPCRNASRWTIALALIGCYAVTAAIAAVQLRLARAAAPVADPV